MSIRSRLSLAAGIVSIAAMIATVSTAQHGPKHHPKFDDPAKWSKSFDDPARDQWQMPDRVIAALALPPAAVVADIGAGTGYLATRLARNLPQGIVYASDVEQAMVDHLAARAKHGGIANLRAVRATETSPNLPEPVDMAVLLNVYHHIAARPDYFRRLRASLKPGGRVAIVDFRPESPAGAPKHMRLSATQIASEMTAAGYRQVASHDFLPRQNFIVFQPKD